MPSSESSFFDWLVTLGNASDNSKMKNKISPDNKLESENNKMNPKIELHCHLDGSVRPETVKDLAGMHETVEVIEAKLMAPIPCESLVMYLTCFDLPIKVMQTSEALTRIAFEVMEDAAADGVKYIEIRFAPHQHMQEGLTLYEIIEAVLTGIRRAEAIYEIKGNVILSYLRNKEVSGFDEMIEAGEPFLRKGVVAVDLCGAENDLFSSRFQSGFEKARAIGYDVTIHAGETGILQNVIEAVFMLGATRIGHGTALMQSNEAMTLMADKCIMIECCPTSNLQTKAVTSLAVHPIKQMILNEVPVSINTDNRTVSGTDMTKEWELVSKAYRWHDDLCKKITAQSIEASFASEAVKLWLKSFL